MHRKNVKHLEQGLKYIRNGFKIDFRRQIPLEISLTKS